MSEAVGGWVGTWCGACVKYFVKKCSDPFIHCTFFFFFHTFLCLIYQCRGAVIIEVWFLPKKRKFDTGRQQAKKRCGRWMLLIWLIDQKLECFSREASWHALLLVVLPFFFLSEFCTWEKRHFFLVIVGRKSCFGWLPCLVFIIIIIAGGGLPWEYFCTYFEEPGEAG